VHRRSLFGRLILALTVALAGALPGSAQSNMTMVAQGLNGPRGLFFDADDNLYVAEAGTGGEMSMGAGEGEMSYGPTSQITRIAPDGTQSVFLPFFASAGNAVETIGLAQIEVVGDSIWLLTSKGAPNQPFNDALIQLDRTTFRVRNFVDLFTYEAENDTDGTGEIDSNPTDFTVGADGTVYIVDTGANALFTWTAESGLEPFIVWRDNPVPTAIAFAADGSFYIAFLGTGIAPGAGHVEHWNADGSVLLETIGGMTAVTDVLVATDGTVYVVELMQFGDQGPAPNSGRISALGPAGLTVYADGLNTPYALAQDADGNLYVSTGSAFNPPGSGAVVRLGM